MTTVGYGDITPKTDAGKLAISLLIVATLPPAAFFVECVVETFESIFAGRTGGGKGGKQKKE